MLKIWFAVASLLVGCSAADVPATDMQAPPDQAVVPPDFGAPDLTDPGCGKDTDCKGSRICVNRACVDPPLDMTVVDLEQPADLAVVLDMVPLPDLAMPDLVGVDFAGTCVNAGDCNLPHATSTCTTSNLCAVTVCASGYANCNSVSVDGCEIGLLNDVNNCGGCKHVCTTIANGVAACKNAECVVGGCNFGFADCDGNVATGCETNTQTDVNNCGACKLACPAPSSGAASCVSGKCGP